MADIGRNGVFLTILAQTCFISTYCFLIFVARLQRFDKTQEEAALDLGASQTQVFFKILMPYLMPAIASSAVIAFLYSFENYNTTVFSILSDQTLTTVIASKVRLGISPAISALALVIIAITLTAAISYEVLKRREERRLAKIKQMQLHQAMPSDRLMKNQKTGFRLPKSMFLILLVCFGVIAGGNYLASNNLYGEKCIVAADEAKNRISLISSNYFSRMLVTRALPHRNLAQPQAVRDLIIFLAIPTCSKILVGLILKLNNKTRSMLASQTPIAR